MSEVNQCQNVPWYKDAERLVKMFSQEFREKSNSPMYYVCRFDGPQKDWDIFEMDDPVKSVNKFLPYCKFPDVIRTKYYYKAERANQGGMVSQVLSNFLFQRMTTKNLYYNGYLVTALDIQFLNVKGHTNPLLLPEEVPLLDKTVSIPLIRLTTEAPNDNVVYFDVCGPQVDIYAYDEDGYPFIKYHSIPEPKQLLAPQHNKDVTVVELESDVIPIKSDKPYREYLDDIGEAVDDDAVNYHEFFYKNFSEKVKKLAESDKNRLRKLAKKEKASNNQ